MMPCTSSRKSSISTIAAVADVGFVIAIGAGVATAVMYATSGKESHLVVAPTSEGGAAATVFGRF